MWKLSYSAVVARAAVAKVVVASEAAPAASPAAAVSDFLGASAVDPIAGNVAAAGTAAAIEQYPSSSMETIL